jgi:hypothetical protein
MDWLAHPGHRYVRDVGTGTLGDMVLTQYDDAPVQG